MVQEMVSRKEQIANIIATRAPLVGEIEKQQQALLRVGRTIRTLEKVQTSMIASGEVGLIERAKSVNFTAIQAALQTEFANLTKLRERFNRKTLNIGVIGRARQGKSLLLQRFSGLTSNEIPDGELGACTGVRSTVSHHPTASYAEVYYYTESEFLKEVIAPYYTELELGTAPESVTQFATSVLPELPAHLEKQATAIARHNYLKKYHTHIHECRALFRLPSPQRLDNLDEVRQYIAQQTLDGKDIYTYLAVREVKIYCPFPYARDVEQVAFIDMPGLGDTGLGDEKRLIKAMGEDIDVALLVRKPTAGGALWEVEDTELYDTAQKALQDLLPLHQWAFLILNRTFAEGKQGDNLANCEDLRTRMSSVFTSTSGQKAFVESIIANCYNSEEVNTKILDPVLDYLLMNIARLDRQYADSCRDGLRRLKQRIAEELVKARAAFGTGESSTEDFIKFQGLFDKLWEDLTNGFEALVTEQKKKSTVKNPKFAEYFEKCFALCRNSTNIPSIEEIKTLRNVEGSFMNVYNTALNEVRAHLTYHFLNLDDALRVSMNDVKQETAEVFLRQGQLAALTQKKGYEFFQEMAEQRIPANLTLTRLKFVFRAFAKYELSYRGFFQQRIRSKLDLLYPDRTNVKPNLPANIDADREAAAKEVHETLKRVHTQVVEILYKELTSWLTEPGQAAYATVEEFVDQMIRAKGAKNDWSIFYQGVKYTVWDAQYKKIKDYGRYQKEWLAALEEIEEANTFV